MSTERWTFGLPANPQALALAPLWRELSGAVLALEGDEPVVEGLIDQLRQLQADLAALMPSDLKPRVGDDVTLDRRPYLDHSRDIGAFNPAFPEYQIEVQGSRASGGVTFPLAYEGPPGLVHGGFLALFFDCVMQHHSCDVGQAGKTVSLEIAYRRPTPLLEPLRFEVDRVADDRRITSTGKLLAGNTTLCEATMIAVAGDRARLPAVHPRRPGA